MTLSQHPLILAGLIGLGAVVSSALWTAWHRAVSDLNAPRAAVLDTLIVVLSTLTVLEYTHAPLALLGYYAGTFVGTYLSVRSAARRALRAPLGR